MMMNVMMNMMMMMVMVIALVMTGNNAGVDGTACMLEPSDLGLGFTVGNCHGGVAEGYQCELGCDFAAGYVYSPIGSMTVTCNALGKWSAPIGVCILADIRPAPSFNLAGDDRAVLVPLPFSFPFYTNVYTEAYIDTNAVVAFAGSNIERLNYCSAWQMSGFPDSSVYPWNFIAAFYDDLFSSGNDILFLRTVTLPSRPPAFLVQWTGMTFWDGSGTHEDAPTVQLWLFQNGDIGIRFLTNLFSSRQRGAVNGNIGITNAQASQGVTILHKTNLDSTRSFLLSRTLIDGVVTYLPSEWTDFGGVNILLQLHNPAVPLAAKTPFAFIS